MRNHSCHMFFRMLRKRLDVAMVEVNDGQAELDVSPGDPVSDIFFVAFATATWHVSFKGMSFSQGGPVSDSVCAICSKMDTWTTSSPPGITDFVQEAQSRTPNVRFGLSSRPLKCMTLR